MGSKRKASAPKKLKETPLERARSGKSLTLREWPALLADAKAGSLQPTVKGGAPPETSKRRGTADDGTKAAQQYRARFLAWDAGSLPPPEPRDSLPAAELPDAEARRYAGHLSPAEMAAEKSKFIDQARRSAEEAVNLGECEEQSTLLRHAALRAAAWLGDVPAGPKVQRRVVRSESEKCRRKSRLWQSPEKSFVAGLYTK